MICYLDSNIVIYFVENPPRWGPLAKARIARLQSVGDLLAVSDLTRMECQVGPLKRGDDLLLRQFRAFFATAGLQIIPLTGIVCDGAAAIRATHGFKPLDALHLAAAIEARCGLFLTHDARLSGFRGISVEVL